jgi:hypothetical protein
VINLQLVTVWSKAESLLLSTPSLLLLLQACVVALGK